MLLLVLGAGCSPALDNRRPTAAPVAGQQEKPVDNRLKLPNEDLAAKHEAAKATPQAFDPVFAYAKAVTDFCVASLVDTSCPDCTSGRVKYKTELEVQNWLLAQDALTRLGEFKDGKELTPAQFEQFVGVKGRLLGLAGHAAEERTLIDGYVAAHPDAVPVVRRRLEILRNAGDVKESESQCRRSRVSMKSAPDAARLELLTSCVALHPENADGRTDPTDYTRYLPDPAKAERRLYRRHLVERCVASVGSKEARCGQACDCQGQPDKQQKARCKQGCRNCRMETAQKIRECKKSGGVSAAAPRPRAPNAPTAAPSGPAPQTTVL